MKIKFLLAVMLFATINVFGQTPTFTSNTYSISPGGYGSINGTNLTGVTKVILKWNNPNNTNTLSIIPYSVTSTSIDFNIPDTSFFWYAHYAGVNSVDLVTYSVVKNNQTINTNLSSSVLIVANDPVFTTIINNPNGSTTFKGRYIWDDNLGLGLTDGLGAQYPTPGNYNFFNFVRTANDSMSLTGSFYIPAVNQIAGNCNSFNAFFFSRWSSNQTYQQISSYAIDGTSVPFYNDYLFASINNNNNSALLPCNGSRLTLYGYSFSSLTNYLSTKWYYNNNLMEEHQLNTMLQSYDSLVITQPGTYKFEIARGWMFFSTCNPIIDSIVVVGQQQSFTATATADGPTTFCSGNYVYLTATNVAGATYQWKKNGVNITSSGTSRTYKATATGSYTCVVTNACGSTTTNAIQVTTKTNAFATVSASGATSFCAGDSVTLNCTNLGSNYSVQWYRTNISMENATTYTQVVKQPGTYKVVTKNLTTGCSRISGSSVTVAVNCRMANPDIVAVSDENEDESKNIEEEMPKTIRIYPNPTDGSFTFEFQTNEQGTGELNIVNVMGQSIFNTNVAVFNGMVQQQVDLVSDFEKGLYIVRLTINGQQYDRKLILK